MNTSTAATVENHANKLDPFAGALKYYDFNDLTNDDALLFAKNSEINTQLLNSMLEFAKTVKKIGYHVTDYSKTAWKLLNTISDDRKVQITQHYNSWNEIFQIANPRPFLSNPEIDPPSTNIPLAKNPDTNAYFLRKALDRLGLYVDENFWSTLSNDHVVEIYGEHMIQLYRSLNFFDTCGYSLPDLAAHEWYHLWERPKIVLEELISGANEVISKGLPTFKPNIRKHLIKEILNTTATEPFIPRALVVDFVAVACLRCIKTNEPKGLVLTSTVNVVALGAESEKIPVL